MLIYLDTAFTDPAYGDIISLALVAESGDELYLEFTDYPKNRVSAFVRETVEPLLGRTPNTVLTTRVSARTPLSQFLARHPDATIACQHNIDWWLLTELLADAGPGELHAINVSQRVDELRRQHFYVQRRALRNHALHDARACQYACSTNT